jgi:hypothetical protein
VKIVFAHAAPMASEEIASDDLAALAVATARIAFLDGHFALGAQFTFDNLPSMAAVAPASAIEALSPDVRARIPASALIWSLPKGGYVLPIRVAAGTILHILNGGGCDRVVVATPTAVRAHRAESGARITVQSDSWLWISPSNASLHLVSLSLAVQESSSNSLPSAVALARVLSLNYLPTSEIVERANEEAARFTCYPLTPSGVPFNPWRDSEYEDDDRYQVLEMNAMSVGFRNLMIKTLSPFFKTSYFYFQINRYETEDFVLPHRDTLPQGLIMLTSSDADGLTVQTGNKFIRVSDVPGRIVLCDAQAWHWVDPVSASPRFSLVTIPPLGSASH